MPRSVSPMGLRRFDGTRDDSRSPIPTPSKARVEMMKPSVGTLSSRLFIAPSRIRPTQGPRHRLTRPRHLLQWRLLRVHRAPSSVAVREHVGERRLLHLTVGRRRGDDPCGDGSRTEHAYAKLLEAPRRTILRRGMRAHERELLVLGDDP